MNVIENLNGQVERRKTKKLYRQRQVVVRESNACSTIDQRPVVVFSHNDYLGLAQHPEVVRAAMLGAQKYGVGGVSSQLVTGYNTVHQQLEEEFADFLGRERALLFSNGFMANQGVIAAITQKNDLIFADKLVHASIIDACKLSDARFERYPHLNYAKLGEKLLQHQHATKLVVTDSVFSMGGDIADLPRCAKLCEQNNATLMVDDAHGIGVLGERGAGCVEHFGLSQMELPILVCPLAKAFGGMGAIVAGSHELIDGLIQFARSYIYTTAIPPLHACAALASLRIILRDSECREKLNSNIKFFKRISQQLAITLKPSDTPIQIISVGEANKAYEMQQQLLTQGFALNAMRPPTVPEGDSNLRVTLSSLHTESQISELLQRIKDCA